MQKLIISGGNPLIGEVTIAGSKNAALAIMAASVMNAESVSLRGLARLSDIYSMAALLEHLGGEVALRDSESGMIADLRFSEISNYTAAYDFVRKMRAGILVMGPLLARFGRARVSLPGGCAIGTRPVDLHLRGLEALGAKLELQDGYITASAEHGLRGGEYRFPTISVGASANVMTAAVLAKGETLLHNVAQEPEITDLANALVRMGADIQKISDSSFRIGGVSSLHACQHQVIPDRIECGTFAIASVACGGDVVLKNCAPEHLQSLWQALTKIGAQIDIQPSTCRVTTPSHISDNLRPIDIHTAPYPDFPTDLQAQMMSLLCLANGTSHIQENIFENRFMHVGELMRMGANIQTDKNTCTIHGVRKLKGAELMATDLRASASLIIAALAAGDTSTINRIYHLDRGYASPERKFKALGANIQRHE